jgi:hypothetical protein
VLLWVAAFIAAFLAEYYHDRLYIAYNQLTNANIPPWTRQETMRKRVRRALWKTFWLSVLQWFDLVGILGLKLPIVCIASGGIAGSLWATREAMWEDWKEAHARFVGGMRDKHRRVTRGSDGEQPVDSDPDQLPLLNKE